MNLIQQLEKEQFEKLSATKTIPEILISGDHAKVAAWRKAEAEALTRARRPDLWANRSGQKATKSTTDG